VGLLMSAQLGLLLLVLIALVSSGVWVISGRQIRPWAATAAPCAASLAHSLPDRAESRSSAASAQRRHMTPT
jgi:hypothetical protein